VLITLRSVVKPLRKPAVFAAAYGVMADMNARHGKRFRIVHFSLQADSVRLIVEASTRKALLAGVRGVAVSLARRVNQLVDRRGRMFDDRWDGRALSTPEAVRDALVRVFGSFRKQGDAVRASVDPFSSGAYFAGFAEYDGKPPLESEPQLVPRALRERGVPVVEAGVPLLADGWLALGPISITEVPEGD
jgi:hypothetical protein